MKDKKPLPDVPVCQEIMDFYRNKGYTHCSYITIALVFGAVTDHCQRRDGICRASLLRMAVSINKSLQIFRGHLKALVADGFIVDLTPHPTAGPHIFVDGGKISGMRYNKYSEDVIEAEEDIIYDPEIAKSKTAYWPKVKKGHGNKLNTELTPCLN